MNSFVNIHHHGPSSGSVSIQNFDYWEDLELPKGFFSAGIHPWFPPTEEQWVAIQKAWDDPRCLALGECGLDRLRGDKLEEQKKWFELQLQSQDLPVLIHAVKVDAELWEVFQAFPSKKWVIHGAMGKWERWKKFVSEGVCFSFGKGLLNDAATQETFRNIPMEQLFLETDAADPNLLESIYRQAAAIKQKEMDVVKQEIWSNFATTFEKYGT
jgi:TatD DNase family protein